MSSQSQRYTAEADYEATVGRVEAAREALSNVVDALVAARAAAGKDRSAVSDDLHVAVTDTATNFVRAVKLRSQLPSGPLALPAGNFVDGCKHLLTLAGEAWNVTTGSKAGLANEVETAVRFCAAAAYNAACLFLFSRPWPASHAAEAAFAASRAVRMILLSPGLTHWDGVDAATHTLHTMAARIIGEFPRAPADPAALAQLKATAMFRKRRDAAVEHRAAAAEYAAAAGDATSAASAVGRRTAYDEDDADHPLVCSRAAWTLLRHHRGEFPTSVSNKPTLLQGILSLADQGLRLCNVPPTTSQQQPHEHAPRNVRALEVLSQLHAARAAVMEIKGNHAEAAAAARTSRALHDSPREVCCEVRSLLAAGSTHDAFSAATSAAEKTLPAATARTLANYFATRGLIDEALRVLEVARTRLLGSAAAQHDESSWRDAIDALDADSVVVALGLGFTSNPDARPVDQTAAANRLSIAGHAALQIADRSQQQSTDHAASGVAAPPRAGTAALHRRVFQLTGAAGTWLVRRFRPAEAGPNAEGGEEDPQRRSELIALSGAAAADACIQLLRAAARFMQESTPDEMAAILSALARAYEFMGDTASAASCAAEAVERTPDGVAALYVRASIAAAAQDLPTLNRSIGRIARGRPVSAVQHALVALVAETVGAEATQPACLIAIKSILARADELNGFSPHGIQELTAHAAVSTCATLDKCPVERVPAALDEIRVFAVIARKHLSPAPLPGAGGQCTGQQEDTGCCNGDGDDAAPVVTAVEPGAASSSASATDVACLKWIGWLQTACRIAGTRSQANGSCCAEIATMSVRCIAAATSMCEPISTAAAKSRAALTVLRTVSSVSASVFKLSTTTCLPAPMLHSLATMCTAAASLARECAETNPTHHDGPALLSGACAQLCIASAFAMSAHTASPSAKDTATDALVPSARSSCEQATALLANAVALAQLTDQLSMVAFNELLLCEGTARRLRENAADDDQLKAASDYGTAVMKAIVLGCAAAARGAVVAGRSADVLKSICCLVWAADTGASEFALTCDAEDDMLLRTAAHFVAVGEVSLADGGHDGSNVAPDALSEAAQHMCLFAQRLTARLAVLDEGNTDGVTPTAQAQALAQALAHTLVAWGSILGPLKAGGTSATETSDFFEVKGYVQLVLAQYFPNGAENGGTATTSSATAVDAAVVPNQED